MDARNKFTSFAAPYFRTIDSGSLYRRPFVWLYMFFAVLNLLCIVAALLAMFKGGFSGVLIGLFSIAGFWVGFQLWWDRKDKVNSFVTPGSDFVALPVFSHFIQTAGEWFGTLMAIVGTGASLVMALFGSSAGYGDMGIGGMGMMNPMDMFMMGMGSAPVVGIILSPVLGFLIIIISRAVAEQIRALVAVANNTKAIDVNTRRA